MLEQLKTAGGVYIEYEQSSLTYKEAINPVLEQLNSQRGALFASSFEYPGRYTCWDIGFYNPPLSLTVKRKEIYLEALNKRGEQLLTIILTRLKQLKEIIIHFSSATICQLDIIPTTQLFSEEERSFQPSVFTVIRDLLAFFNCDEAYLGFYGAFGYDLIFQFESLPLSKERDVSQRELVLYLPDEIYIVDHRKEEAFIRRYDFHYQGASTQGLARNGVCDLYQPLYKPDKLCDHATGEYEQVVEKAQMSFACGDLFEVVPSQTFYEHCAELPAAIFSRMRQVNPSPYGFFIHLGESEYLVGASPEMYVRVQGQRVESCPISGTIKRGIDAIEDAANIQQLLDSEKECSELTMCTDVDRNDKSRICEAGSVKVIGRRQIELYSRLIHTVDHVEGILREGFDAVDAFLTHMWVVTVTGAPKLWAMNFIEHHEKSPRRWYAGAVGWFGFNGHLNTGLVLRTMRIKEGIAEVRAGATLLYDSIPKAEEQETRLKASAFLALLRPLVPQKNPLEKIVLTGIDKRVLLIDHQDSFVHTLANYFRQTGALVKTVRYNRALDYLVNEPFDLIVLSPGPGRPNDFNTMAIIDTVLDLKRPLFGVCLGLQAIVEYFGGDLDVLDYPMHGKASKIFVDDYKGLFKGFSSSFIAGRYHSLYARNTSMPEKLTVTAHSQDGIIMAIAHKKLPIHAVQFHPETILSLQHGAGFTIISNLMTLL